jgi:hypothetical protein
MTFTNRPNTKSRNTQYITGIKKRFTALSTIPLNGVPYTPAELVTIFQAEMDTADAVVAPRAAWRAKVAAARDAKQKAEAVRPDFETFVRMTFGSDPEALADFGLQPKARRAPKPATKVAAAVQAKATRAAGGSKAVKKAKKAAVQPAPTTPAKA